MASMKSGSIAAEAVMLELGATLGRQHAHDVVYDAAQAAVIEARPFSQMLAADPRVTAHLDAAALTKLLDPVAYTGLCADMALEAAARARAIAEVVGND
jgi:adenylosuccinate lyase